MDNRPSRHRHIRIRSSRCGPPDRVVALQQEIGDVLVRIGLLTESGYPYVTGEARLWCDRLVRGLEVYGFDIFALSRSARQEDQGWVELPPQVHRVRTASLWTAEDDPIDLSRRGRKRFRSHFADLAASVCGDGEDQADRFSSALRGLAELARDEGSLAGALRSESAVRDLERACRAPGARRAAHHARVPDLLAVADLMERALRPLSLDWYDAGATEAEDDGTGLAGVDLCHVVGGGAAALPGLLAKRFFGTPLLITEYGVRLRAPLVLRQPDLRAIARLVEERMPSASLA